MKNILRRVTHNPSEELCVFSIYPFYCLKRAADCDLPHEWMVQPAVAPTRSEVLRFFRVGRAAGGLHAGVLSGVALVLLVRLLVLPLRKEPIDRVRQSFQQLAVAVVPRLEVADRLVLGLDDLAVEPVDPPHVLVSARMEFEHEPRDDADQHDHDEDQSDNAGVVQLDGCLHSGIRVHGDPSFEAVLPAFLLYSI